MAINLLAVSAAGAAAYWYFFKRDPVVPLFEFVNVKGPKSGKIWKTRAVAIDTSGPEKRTTMEVWAPSGSFGPHLDLLVTTYNQVGKERRERGFSGPDSQDAMVDAAIQDFGLIDV
jgi:hypothetical protein